MLARPHTHLSNRAKVRSALERNKPVFRSVLDNPFRIAWCVPFQSHRNTPPTIPRPSVPTNVQNLALARLVASLENVPRAHTSRKFSHQTGSSDNVDVTSKGVQPSNMQTNPSRALIDHVNADDVSGASANLVIGLNEVTRALERQLRLVHKRVVLGHPLEISAQLPPSPPSPIVVVFVCCADVDPTAIIDHIPYLIAGWNSPRNAGQPIKLIPLPMGSEQIISTILGVRRAAVLAFRVWDHIRYCGVPSLMHPSISQHGAPLFETVQDLLDSVPIVSAPWLCHSDTPQLVPTHIKQLRTTAPKDMKAAREQRSKARAAAKKNASSSSRSSIRRKPRVTLTTGSESGA